VPDRQQTFCRGAEAVSHGGDQAVSVIGKTSRQPCRPNNHIQSVGRAHESRPEGPIELQPQEGPLIAGLEVLFACSEHAPRVRRFRARIWGSLSARIHIRRVVVRFLACSPFMQESILSPATNSKRRSLWLGVRRVFHSDQMRHPELSN
jgi:hypothetical protein